jgi:UDP-2,3-diacylglucosamine hydrolase
MHAFAPAAPVVVAPGERALFASDVHAGAHDADTAELFAERLAAEGAGATHVFLLGDLFDAWVGDDGGDAASEQLVGQLARLSARGCRVHVMRGNRDFLLDAERPGTQATFAARCGATMLPDPCVVSLFGRRVLLSHGDALCTDDAEYQRFRALSRSPGWQRDFLARPLDERLAIARDMRARSELSKAGKVDYLMDVSDATVHAVMRAAAVQVLVHGHTHRPACHEFTLDDAPAQRWVLPDWSASGRRGGMLRASADGLEFVGHWPF